jgi:hypothetical protein
VAAADITKLPFIVVVDPKITSPVMVGPPVEVENVLAGIPVVFILRKIAEGTRVVPPPVEFTSKITLSEAPGDDAPLAPPDVSDQLVVSFQRPAEPPTQYLSAICHLMRKLSNAI